MIDQLRPRDLPGKILKYRRDTDARPVRAP